MKHPLQRSLALFLLAAAIAFAPTAAPADDQKTAPAKVITPPKAFFGFNIGDDYCLANYQQFKGYWETLEHESDRIKVQNIGKTEEGRPQLMAVVTAAANHRDLARYQQIAARLARADGVTEAEAARLSIEGKAVVWIDAGIHASESLCPQAMIETVYQLVLANDAETLRILNDVIILFVHANPDGHDLVADWYMRERIPTQRSLAGLPRLYQKYAGHDNNRDFYANTQAETKNMNRVMYREWYPQVMYNHHQTGPAGTVLFCPPFRDPFNYHIDPLVISGIDALGAAMEQRFLAEGKPGATSRSGAPYSTWFNGGLRTTTSFHNIIGLLTETIGGPTPTQIPYLPARQLPKADYLAPIEPQPWHFRQSVDYSVTANKAVLDYASRHREQLLHNIWLMGHNAVERGNRDSWTVTPSVVAAAQSGGNNMAGTGRGRGGWGNAGTTEFMRLFRDPAKRDARGYAIPADQPDFLTATKFVNALLGNGVLVYRATADFEIAGKQYPAGSYVIKSAQAFRAHVLDMFEPQDHPNDFAYPGGPPVRPYDAAGYTLAFQMAVQFDRVLDGFSGPFEEIRDLVVPPPPAKVRDADGAVGFFLSTRANDSFRAVNRLLKAGEEVRRLQVPFVAAGVSHDAGDFFIPRKATTLPLLERIADEIGTAFRGSPIAPGQQAVLLKPVRIALWDRYGGSMPSGWTRWILEQFEFPFEVVYAPDLDKGALSDRFDVLILPDGALGGRGPGGFGGTRAPAEVGGPDQPAPESGGAGGVGDASLPAQYRARRGNFTTSTTLPQVRKFLEAGGTVLAIGSSTNLANDLGLPVKDQLVEKDKDGKEYPLPPEKFFIPPSVLRARVNPADPLAWGVDDQVDVLFATSPTFRLPEAAKGLRRVAWFDTKAPLRSGWAWGQEHLDGGAAIINADVGRGRLVLYGPQVLFRAQPHGTFKFVFNAIARAGAVDVRPPQARLEIPSNEGIAGTLILSGHGPMPAGVLERFITEAGGAKAKIVVITRPGQDADKTTADLTALLKKKEVTFQLLTGPLHGDDTFSKAIDEATGLWLESPPAGDDAAALSEALKKLLGRRGVIGSEGALAAAETFDLLPGATVAALASQNGELAALQRRLGEKPGTFGLGIEERAAVVIKGRRMSGIGEGAVHLLQSPGAGRPASDKPLRGREAADLVAQRRIAYQRTQPPFPPQKMETPRVPAGALLIGGGGGMSEDIWKRFIDLAGGPDAPIVVIPTANEDPMPAEPGEARALKRSGARNVTILHTRNRKEADTEKFVAPLKTAKGIWFSGGRQWRFVEAYEGTATETAFHEVLARGGVIGGSSAGASIQTEYMARGDTLGNLTIIAEGYERGFGFLKGVAVDQHFFARNRTADMTHLVNTYPQLLGIGIDEGTVVIVRGTRMEVVGKSKAAVYDRRKPVVPGEKDYEELPAGSVYDLETRKRVDGP